MNKQYIACPQCGALGEVGTDCEFCGGHIDVKDDSVVCGELIPQHRTISPMDFAKKISIFHNVGNFDGDVAYARIGNLYGVINLNGDLVLPLEYRDIEIDHTRRFLLIKTGTKTRYLIKRSDGGTIMTLPPGSWELVDFSSYASWPNYNDSVLLREYGEAFCYYNVVSKTRIYISTLMSIQGCYCYVDKTCAAKNDEYLTEEGIYDNTLSLFKKVSLNNKGTLGELFMVNSVDEFFAEYEKRKAMKEEISAKIEKDAEMMRQFRERLYSKPKGLFGLFKKK